LNDQSATITISRAVTVAAGAHAPGHLGELTQALPFELVDDVLEQTRTVQRRLRDLPSRVGVYFVLALAMFPLLGYARVWGKLTAGLAGLDVASLLLAARLFWPQCHDQRQCSFSTVLLRGRVPGRHGPRSR